MYIADIMRDVGKAPAALTLVSVCYFLLAFPAVAYAQASSTEASTKMCGGDYQLHFTAPKGWTWDSEELVEEVPAHGPIHIGCYLPHHSASYSDFRERMAEEIKFMRRTYGPVRVRHFHVGSLAAVEVRSPYGKRPDSEYLQTFIDVPVYRNVHELFMVIYATTSHRAVLHRAYLEFLRSCRVTRDDGDSAK